MTIRRHKEQRYIVIEIRCGGKVLEPECLAPAFTKAYFRGDRIFEDGEVITDQTYEAIKAERNANSEG